MMTRDTTSAGVTLSNLSSATDISIEGRLAALEHQHRHALEVITDLRARDVSKTEFLANISHDLRTPLTAIVTHAEILRDGILGELSERQQDSIAGVINGGRQLLDMVGEILTYARGAADQLALTLDACSIEDVILRVTALNESLVARKAIDLSVEVAPDIPDVRIDREKIAHVLGNLLGNAIAFTPPGGRVWVKAQCCGAEPSRELIVEVGDTGIGIDPAHHDLVFREFAQVDASPSRAHHGTGLGLTIARKLVELHDGRIWLESGLGSGSRFFFALPYREDTP